MIDLKALKSGLLSSAFRFELLIFVAEIRAATFVFPQQVSAIVKYVLNPLMGNITERPVKYMLLLIEDVVKLCYQRVCSWWSVLLNVRHVRVS